MSDNLGYGDLPYNGDRNLLTPNIDALAADGVILNNFHAQSLCSPSRGAFLSGYYPIHSGQQHIVIQAQEPQGFPLNKKLLSNYLKELGYATHLIGKWHLGFYKKEYTPTFRGFDSYFGFWTGAQDYFNHITQELPQDTPGYDFRRNMNLATNVSGIFSTDLFTDEAIKVINQHDTQSPFFLLFAYQNVHEKNNEPIMEAPRDLLPYFPHIEDNHRKLFAANLLSMDLSIGRLFESLHTKGMLNDSIILFFSDNGASIRGGSNYPLRGTKAKMWQGSFRVPAFVWSPLLKKKGYVSNELIHVTDLLPTLMEAIGENPEMLGNIDGKSQWNTFVSNAPSSRIELLYEIDPVFNISAIRVGKWKLIQGDAGLFWTGWFKPPQLPTTSVPKMKNTSVEEILRLMNRKPNYNVMYEKKIDCGQKPVDASTNCQPGIEHCLFNLDDDPCKFINVAHAYPKIVHELWGKLVAYNKTAIPMQKEPIDPCGNPNLHNGVLTNWHDTDLCIKREFTLVFDDFKQNSSFKNVLHKSQLVVTFLMLIVSSTQFM